MAGSHSGTGGRRHRVRRSASTRFRAQQPDARGDGRETRSPSTSTTGRVDFSRGEWIATRRHAPRFDEPTTSADERGSTSWNPRFSSPSWPARRSTSASFSTSAASYAVAWTARRRGGGSSAGRRDPRSSRLQSRLPCPCLLGHVHRDRGMNAQALAVYRRALDVAEACSNVQGTSKRHRDLPALAREHPGEAERCATRALELARSFEIGLASALVDSGWASLARGDRIHAEMLAREADEALRSRRVGPGLADVLELRALSAEDPRRETARLEEALAIWREAESPLRRSPAAACPRPRHRPGRTGCPQRAQRTRSAGSASRPPG